MRILWYSNAPWAATGYGTQTAQVTPRIRDLGHDLAIANNYGLQATMTRWNGIPVLTQGYDAHSRDILPAHADVFRADWILTLYDVWVFDRGVFHDRRVASWVPVDHDPAPPQIVAWCREHLPIAMSRFGQRALQAQGIDARYVPHAIDTSVYQPVDGAELRAAMNVPADAHLTIINAANKGLPARKAWPDMLRAWGDFAKRHGDAFLYLHTDVEGMVGGMKLPILMAYLGLPADRVRKAPQYELLTHAIMPGQMAALYSASDVLLSTSMGEGFGLAVVESQACGTPVIVTDFTAQPELIGAGWKVGYQPWYDYTQAADWATPLVPEIVEALEASYAAKGNQDLRNRATAFAAQYDADLVFETHWKPVLAEMEAILTPPVRKGMSNAAKRRAARRKAA